MVHKARLQKIVTSVLCFIMLAGLWQWGMFDTPALAAPETDSIEELETQEELDRIFSELMSQSTPNGFDLGSANPYGYDASQPFLL